MLHCGKETIPRDKMEEHMTTQCPNMEVVCPFSPHGCDFKVSYYSSFIARLIEEKSAKNKRLRVIVWQEVKDGGRPKYSILIS